MWFFFLKYKLTTKKSKPPSSFFIFHFDSFNTKWQTKQSWYSCFLWPKGWSDLIYFKKRYFKINKITKKNDHVLQPLFIMIKMNTSRRDYCHRLICEGKYVFFIVDDVLTSHSILVTWTIWSTIGPVTFLLVFFPIKRLKKGWGSYDEGLHDSKIFSSRTQSTHLFLDGSSYITFFFFRECGFIIRLWYYVVYGIYSIHKLYIHKSFWLWSFFIKITYENIFLSVMWRSSIFSNFSKTMKTYIGYYYTFWY